MLQMAYQFLEILAKIWQIRSQIGEYKSQKIENYGIKVYNDFFTFKV